MENKWTDVSYCVFKSSFCTPALWNHLTVGGKRVRSCLTWAERTGKDRKCLSEARGGEWNGTGTDFKGQCCLYCPTPFFFFFPGLSLKNVRKRDSKRKSWRGGEKPIMTETVRKVHRLWLSLCICSTPRSCQSGSCKASFQGVSRCRLSPSLLNSSRPLKQVAVQLMRTQQHVVWRERFKKKKEKKTCRKVSQNL